MEAFKARVNNSSLSLVTSRFLLRQIAFAFGFGEQVSLALVGILSLSCNLYAQGVVDAERAVYKVTLEEVTDLAIENNFEIQLARYDAWIARTQEGVAKSIYDTLFEAEVQYQDNQQAQSSSIFGTKVVTNEYNIGLKKNLPTGTTLELDQTNERTSTNSTFSTSPLVHDSTISFEITQELGKNFFGLQDRGDVKLTLIDIENSEYISLESIEMQISEVQKAYWEYVQSREIVKIEEGMVFQAKKLYDLQQEKLKDGLVESPEAIASEANYRTHINDLTIARNNRKLKENVLKLQLNISDEKIEIVPADSFILKNEQEQLKDALKKAFEHRRDYKRKLNDVKSKELNLSMKKNNLWPEINLSASLAQNGLGDHFKQASSNITEENNPNLTAGITFSYPLANSKAKAEKKSADLEKEKALVGLKFIERTIAIEINDQVRNCNVLKEVAINANRVEDLQEKKFRAEEKRFNTGRSDTDTIIRFQEDWLNAQRRSVDAKKLYLQALIDLRQREGILLGGYWKEEL